MIIKTQAKTIENLLSTNKELREKINAVIEQDIGRPAWDDGYISFFLGNHYFL
jgi:hypothetical protein